MRPLGHLTQIAQRRVDRRSDPHLPAHRVGVVAQEVGQLQRLLDLLKENFDLPAATMEVGDTALAPLQVFGFSQPVRCPPRRGREVIG